MASPDRTDAMNEDQREIIRRLFTTATDRLETAHEIAASGQSSALSGPEYADLAQTLGNMAKDVATFAETVQILADSRPENPTNNPKNSC